MPAYGTLILKRATSTTSFGSTIGVFVERVVMTHKSTARAIANIRSGASNGSIIIPCDIAGTTAAARYTDSVILDNQGLSVNNKGFIQVSGASTVGYIYYRNLR